MAYSAAAPERFGATTWHEVKISEARALRAIGEGGMVINAPDGHPIRLQYARRLQHAGGNWTWIGTPAGASTGEDAILTFGPRAVFGMIPDGAGGLLEVTTRGGKTWIGASALDATATANLAADMLQAPTPHVASLAKTPRGPHMTAAGAQVSSQGSTAATTTTTIDLVAGYTTAFATRLGGNSQAITRLNFLVDVANQAYANSEVAGQLRLVATVPVDYADATLNRTALFELTGVSCTNVSGPGQHSLPDRRVNCTTAPTPTALQPLLAARTAYGADLAVLVRNYSVPENQSCGVAWLLGGGQAQLTRADAPFGLAVISDSNGSVFPDSGSTCRHETLVHELGHNMGLAHNVEEAQGSTDRDGDGNLLDPEEFGRFADSFGYSTDSSHGNFYTIMSVPVSGQTGFRVFSNPGLTTCGGAPCGVIGQADNARTLGVTMPIIAQFGAPHSASIWVRGDFNGDHKADILWRNIASGANAIWLSGNKATPQAVAPVDIGWYIAGVGDFNGDGRADIVWRSVATGANVLWPSAQRDARTTLPSVPTSWSVATVGDFTGDKKADLVWRDSATGADTLWPSANRSLRKTLGTVPVAGWTVAAAADFNGDGKADLVWRNTATGANVKWPAALQSAKVVLPTVATSWAVAGAADFDGNGQADLLWRDGITGSNTVWRSANRDTRQSIGPVADLNWYVAGAGDFNGDGRADIMWRNIATGGNSFWLSANQATKQSLASLVGISWMVGG